MDNTYEIKVENIEEALDGGAIVSMKGLWGASAVEWECIFRKNDGGGNSSNRFNLKISGGQVEKGEIEMFGEWEREAFIDTLEIILVELKRK